MVGKRKNPSDNALPPRVYRGRKNYEFHPPAGGSIKLCALDAHISVVWKEYERVNNRQAEKKDLAGLIANFFLSPAYFALSASTQSDYKKNSKKILPVFGSMHPDSIKPQHVRKYLDKRGLRSQIQANREKSFLSRVFKWGYERGMVKGNPCTGVRKFKEQERDRYITDAEYNAVYAAANDMIRVAMELAYLCCARQMDVLALTRGQLLEEGIYICQNKTNKKQIKAWSPRLRSVIAMSEALPLKPGLTSIYVLHQRNGNRYTRDGFNSAWAKARAKAEADNLELKFDFTFHDLKAKGISDLEGNLQDKQTISGHKSISQTARYDRKIQIVPVVGNQEK